ncbi:MAG: hypothetical protein KDA83_18045, partial [Planctomycetales bacterium]|nr:hypothetical protein [Planctomycetales bacterium]
FRHENQQGLGADPGTSHLPPHGQQSLESGELVPRASVMPPPLDPRAPAARVMPPPTTIVASEPARSAPPSYAARSVAAWFSDEHRNVGPRVALTWASSDSLAPAPGSSAWPNTSASSIDSDSASPISTRTTSSRSRANQSAASAEERRLWAAAPEIGDHFFDPEPRIDCGLALLPPHLDDFSPDPIHSPLCYDGEKQIDVYAGKKIYATQRPLLEWGREMYGPGQFPRSLTFLGASNLVTPQLLVYGDFRSAIAANRVNGDSRSVWANRLNLDIDFEITSTERFHAFMGPLDSGNQFTRVEYDGGNVRFEPRFDPDIDFAFFEGDAGAMWGGFRGEVMPFTLPFAAGVFPMFVQNGYWLNDAFLGTAVTLPARNSPLLDIANYDVTVFTGFDNVSSPAFGNDDNVAKIYGVTSWIEAYNGYIELGYGFADDRSGLNRSYHNITAAYSRRYGAFLSNSVRVIANAGQNPNGVPQSADGVLLVCENSFITSQPWTTVPYFNFFAGFDRPQSLARAAGAGGILNHTGINFETDGLTGFPTLDSSANNTWGGAVGLNLLPQDFSQQLVAEFAFVQAFGEDSVRIAPGDQYGLGLRYQIPISNAVILRADAMHGFLESADDVSGIRFEFRHKF